jgi:hypothetical protein
VLENGTVTVHDCGDQHTRHASPRWPATTWAWPRHPPDRTVGADRRPCDCLEPAPASTRSWVRHPLRSAFRHAVTRSAPARCAERCGSSSCARAGRGVGRARARRWRQRRGEAERAGSGWPRRSRRGGAIDAAPDRGE